MGKIVFQRDSTLRYEDSIGSVEFLSEVTGLDSPLVVYREPRNLKPSKGYASDALNREWLESALAQIKQLVESTGHQVSFE
jgi:hypothetical protein